MRKVLFCVMGCGFCVESSATTETMVVVDNEAQAQLKKQAKNIGTEPLVQNVNVASVFAKIVKTTGVELKGTQNPNDLSQWLPEFTFDSTSNEALNEKFELAKNLINGVRAILQANEADSGKVVGIYKQLIETTSNGFYNVSNAIISGMLLGKEEQKSLRESVDSAWQLLWQAREVLDFKMAQWGYWAGVDDLDRIELFVDRSPEVKKLRGCDFFELLFSWKCLATPEQVGMGLIGDAGGRPLTKDEKNRLIDEQADLFLKRVKDGGSNEISLRY